MTTNTKTGKFGIAITLAVIFILVGAIFVFNSMFDSQNPVIGSQNVKNNAENLSIKDNEIKDNEISPVAKYAEDLAKKENITSSSSYSSTIDSMPLTSKPNFKIGEKYTYNIKYPNAHYGIKNDPNVILNDYIYFNVTFEVKDKERINKSEWYLISPEGLGQAIVGYIRTYTGVVKPLRRTMFNPGEKIYINTENGEVMHGGTLDRFRIYSPWMLKLSKDLKWTEKMEENSTGGGIGTGVKYNVVKKNLNNVREETYEVKGIEKINGRDCFKVESRVKSCTNQKCVVKHKKLFWIDIEKRITVKFQLWYENLNTVNVDLVNYKK